MAMGMMTTMMMMIMMTMVMMMMMIRNCDKSATLGCGCF